MPFVGCIADDFTGATDLANNLVREGLRAVQIIGVPSAADMAGLDAADAVIIALKTRTVPVDEAVAQSRAALEALKVAGCQRFFFKYCSTFDSTPEGNIGPVAEALLADLGEAMAIAAPAFPANGRTVLNGELFVDGVPLNESGMQNHPLTPMTDSNLVRWLGTQCRGEVGLIDHQTIDAGVEAIRDRAADLGEVGVTLAIVDGKDEQQLRVVGEAFADARLITGGSGIAMGLPAPWRAAGQIEARADAGGLAEFNGATAVISGSCSVRTREQVAAFADCHPSLGLDPLAIADNPEGAVAEALAWAEPKLSDGPVLIYSTDSPDAVLAAQSRLGSAEAGALIERALAQISLGLVDAGVRRLIVAGGETSGAVVSTLGIQVLRIGPQIDPGVPWTGARLSRGADAPPIDLALALKSGNFGGVDFFTRAFEVCP
ncbi:hypothetical protein GJ672_05505 [Spiribacter sp. 2438]|uniref:3-oxo-tetronate kinase n=1 Tax=Spiribacter sp. 2438 TaxID=2666185 RepID=UPI0012AF3F1E|nr:3-oxo-tetronate kinase [Spiribacter sp. 2438]QGM21774.1 hypothetical protein GJ672_05505 [Spiribacter sp. 2438]